MNVETLCTVMEKYGVAAAVIIALFILVYMNNKFHQEHIQQMTELMKQYAEQLSVVNTKIDNIDTKVDTLSHRITNIETDIKQDNIKK